MTSSVQFDIVCLSLVGHFCARYQQHCPTGGGGGGGGGGAPDFK